MTVVDLAALVAAALLAAGAAFQVGLAAGVPLGEATMGGRAPTVDGVLQGPYRVVAIASALLLIVAAWVVLARAGIATIPLGDDVVAWVTWIVGGFLVLNTLTNLSGRHPLERWGMASATLVASLLVGYVALAAPAPM